MGIHTRDVNQFQYNMGRHCDSRLVVEPGLNPDVQGVGQELCCRIPRIGLCESRGGVRPAPAASDDLSRRVSCFVLRSDRQSAGLLFDICSTGLRCGVISSSKAGRNSIDHIRCAGTPGDGSLAGERPDSLPSPCQPSRAASNPTLIFSAPGRKRQSSRGGNCRRATNSTDRPASNSYRQNRRSARYF